MTKFQVGAQMYSVRDHTGDAKSLREALKTIKAIGYNTCQLSGQGKDIAPELIRDFLQEAGVTCCATHVSFEAMESDFDALVRTHKLWNCAYPGIGGLPGVYREAGSAGYIEFAKRASAIADKFLDHGMYFIYHNHAFELERFDDGKTGLDLLMEHSSKALQFELDLFWVQAGGANPVDWVHKVAGRMDVVHFKEMNGSTKPPLMAPIGVGNMDWPAIFKACDEIGVKYALIEQDNAVDSDSFGCMEISYKNLVKLGARF